MFILLLFVGSRLEVPHASHFHVVKVVVCGPLRTSEALPLGSWEPFFQ